MVVPLHIVSVGQRPESTGEQGKAQFLTAERRDLALRALYRRPTTPGSVMSDLRQASVRKSIPPRAAGAARASWFQHDLLILRATRCSQHDLRLRRQTFRRTSGRATIRSARLVLNPPGQSRSRCAWYWSIAS
jgi:hypothetical protein